MKLDLFKEYVNNIEEDKIEKLIKYLNLYEDIIIIGNGGSNSIASHISVDYTKFLNKRCYAFTDASMLTAFMNDEGVENSYKEYLKNFANDKTLVILISSSGNSMNIYKSAEHCNKSGIPFITLTGFNEDNKVRKDFSESSLLDIWVDSNSYAIVECMHLIYLHAAVDV